MDFTYTYVDLTDANEYFNNHIYKDYWESVDDTRHLQLLITSSRRFDNLLYIGEVVDLDQTLQFPRNIKNFVNNYGSLMELYAPIFEWLQNNIKTDEIPNILKIAVLEYSIYLLLNYYNIEYAIDSQVFNSISLGNMGNINLKSDQDILDKVQLIPTAILDMIKLLLIDTYIQFMIADAEYFKQKMAKIDFGKNRILR